jgi:hypothetical protein
MIRKTLFDYTLFHKLCNNPLYIKPNYKLFKHTDSFEIDKYALKFNFTRPNSMLLSKININYDNDELIETVYVTKRTYLFDCYVRYEYLKNGILSEIDSNLVRNLTDLQKKWQKNSNCLMEKEYGQKCANGCELMCV